MAAGALPAESPRVIEHVKVFAETGRYGGWPANHGVWSWGNEIVVGYEIGYFKDNPTGHDVDWSRPVEHVAGRSLDGGRTWKTERPAGLRPPANLKVAGLVAAEGGKQPGASPGGIDFTHPDFAMTFRMSEINGGPSRFYHSNDRGKSWDGPFALPDFGQPGTAARTDYIVEGKHELLAFITVAKRNRREGRVAAIRTRDGGKSWDLVSFIGPEPEDYAIMPSTVRVGPTDLVTAIRRRRWVDVYRSNDEGASWQFLNQAVLDIGGNPPCLVRLKDGRIVMTFGYRLKPFGIRARISKDNGLSWSDDIILRQDGGGTDLGYTRTVLRPDGNLVTAYYYNEDAGKERYIGATIWSAG